MENKGFTLIELLAIIVILAIIAVITVPIILGIIDNSKKGAAIDSAYNYKDAVYKSFLTDLSADFRKELPDGTYSLNNVGKLVRGNPLSELTVNVSGTVPSEGWMELVKGEVEAFSLKFGEYVVTMYSDKKLEAIKYGEIAENSIDKENRLETERQTNAIAKAKALVSSETGETEIKDIADGWVVFINGSLKAYSVRVTEGGYIYVVTDLDVNSDNSNADASRVTTELSSSASGEQLIINYYSEQVAIEVASYISSLSSDSTVQGFTIDEVKKVSELATAVSSGIDNNSWIYYEQASTSITDYSVKMTKNGYSFVVNCIDGIVSEPVYNGELAQKPASFAYDEWTDIVANLTANRNFYPIGSEKIIEFDRNNDGKNEYYKLRLVNTAPCGNYTGSRTSCGVVIEFVTKIGTHAINSSNTNVGGWYSSEMRSWLNSDVLALLPSDLKSVIIPTAPIISGSGKKVASNDVVIVLDSQNPQNNFYGDELFLLSAKEVGFDLNYDNKKADTDTKTLKYYVDNTDDLYRVKYNMAKLSGDVNGPDKYWLRSAFSYYTTSFYCVTYEGKSCDSSAEKSYYVTPAFRILD